MANPLSPYRAKRDPAKTPEPMGGTKRVRRSSSPSFVIQEHHARRLHWDFRLEHDGVLASWALPKGLPETTQTNHLAVQTEDHPLEYGQFEGDIPKGQYGGGHVEIWDHGTYDLEKWSDREVMVVLHGERASGRFVLFRTNDEKWMIHRMDAPLSPMPSQLSPMLALLGTFPTDSANWAYEFKWDGIRAIIYVDGDDLRIMSRNAKDLTAMFPELRTISAFFGTRPVILDGEIVALDDESRPDFGRLQQRLHLESPQKIEQRAKKYPAVFLAFDLLYDKGRSLLDLGYEERRQRLDTLGFAGNEFATPPSVKGANGEDMLAVARDRGLEGVVVKRVDAPYRPGQRDGSWLKVKNFTTQEVVIGGWTEGRGERKGSLGALLVGVHRDDGLLYAGRVGTGFTETTRQELLESLAPFPRPDSPFSNRLSNTESVGARFVEPKLVGEVRFSGWTHDERLRHASWRGLRLDKDPSEVTRES